ncbi:CIC11C00000004731 [Sungouiella intermedia]|uniref:CIC11C00000004731 n=1 Tax=Sungouiella intermedia TaxID=45354 RepID=A0A1L0DQ65_9ASCO|nr:CIC11C00000004731 [[Candida] intermedia]
MKKFLGMLKKDSKEAPKEASADSHDTDQASGNASVLSEPDSLRELHPMFEDHTTSFTNDTNLNLNPSILGGNSVFTEASTALPKSIFSSKYSSSTKQSSYFSQASRTKKPVRTDYGQPLQILEVPEDSKEDISGSSSDIIADKLHKLWQDIFYILNQYTASVHTLSTTVINMINCLKDYVAFVDTLNPYADAWSFSSYNNDDVRKILRMYLHMYDNLLKDDAYLRLKLLLCKVFNDFNASLKSHTRNLSHLLPDTMAKPTNFAIGINDGLELPNQEAISRIIAKVANSPLSVKEQNGSFIAPIARGIDKDMNVLCLYFGYPTLTDHHSRIVSSVQDLFEDVHVLLAKNQIDLASATTESRPNPVQLPSFPPGGAQKFKLPFRNPVDPLRPPMSLSLSVETSARVSGTMGGFIFPIIDTKKQPHLTSYANSKFAISCGHVCLDKRDDSDEYPYVHSPLSVLISLYKQALTAQHQKCGDSNQNMLQLQVAYGSILEQLDEFFPPREVDLYDSKTKQGRLEMRNFPKHRFGQIIWGERTLIQAKNTKTGLFLTDKRLSDLAIIKVNKILQCDQNYLGDDIAFNEYDPSLMFDNLYVRKVINLNRHTKEVPLERIAEVDSLASDENADSLSGLPVFKYGSTTKFTRGNLNGIKLVYWMDGAIHSSEFVVNSQENTTSFAAGGDSGSWILTKLEDLEGSSESKGLGVVGMLHSYDGEYRQFGLFTPMTEILSRLEEVTNIKWGVVGVNQKDMVINLSDSESESEFDEDTDEEDSEYESGVEEQANPPDID